MKLINLVKELRRREVFRTAGLYAGVSWIIIEVSSLLLPTFGAPDWLLRSLVVVAIVGFPVTVVLAWVFDITSEGIIVQADATDTIVLPIGEHRSDYVVIGILLAALILSLTLNAVSDTPTVVEPETVVVSVAVDEFDVSGFDSVSAAALRYALVKNLENAPRVSLCLSAAQFGCAADISIAGSGESTPAGVVLALRAAKPDGETEALEGTAASPEQLFETLGGLAAELLDELRLTDGDTEFQAFLPESTATVSALARADSAWVAGDQAAALFDYERVLAAAAPGSYSPRLRARHAMATELFGNNDAAAARALLEAHLEKYPGDDEARRDLALACFQDRNFDCARQAAIAATNKGTSQDRARTAKYALYAGDFEAAAAESSAVLDVDANNVRSRLTLAALAILKQQPQLAAAEYALVRAAGANELAAAGMLDVDYFLGDAGTAATTDAGQVVLDTAGVAPQSAAQPSDIDSLRALSEAIDKQDHWLLRYERGKVYLRAGYFAEALDEFTECSNRIGEASALFLDDKPTLRVAGELPYWLARAQAELGMAGAAAENFRRFIERRPADPLADDARQRIN